MISLLGIALIALAAFALSAKRSLIDKRTVLGAFLLQAGLGGIVLYVPLGKDLLDFLAQKVIALLNYSRAGIDFLFGGVVGDNIGFVFAFNVLPVIIFFSSMIAVLYYLGVMQWIVAVIGGALRKLIRPSHSESMAAAANIFVGQTEAPILIRPYIKNMTTSELMAIMTGGFATVAGSVLALYVLWLEKIPGIAGHMLAASIMSAPASLVIAKLIYPETGKTNSLDELDLHIEKNTTNAMDALGNGATQGLKLAANIGAMLIAFISILSMINFTLEYFLNINLQEILGIIFSPLAWTMGIPWEEANIVGRLMGEKIVLTELIAYGSLGELINNNLISERSAIISSYALCGFANFGSIGIQLGGIGAMAPEKRNILSKIVLKAMVGGALASWLTATIAGILI